MPTSIQILQMKLLPLLLDNGNYEFLNQSSDQMFEIKNSLNEIENSPTNSRLLLRYLVAAHLLEIPNTANTLIAFTGRNLMQVMSTETTASADKQEEVFPLEINKPLMLLPNVETIAPTLKYGLQNFPGEFDKKIFEVLLKYCLLSENVFADAENKDDKELASFIDKLKKKQTTVRTILCSDTRFFGLDDETKLKILASRNDTADNNADACFLVLLKTYITRQGVNANNDVIKAIFNVLEGDQNKIAALEFILTESRKFDQDAQGKTTKSTDNYSAKFSTLFMALFEANNSNLNAKTCTNFYQKYFSQDGWINPNVIYRLIKQGVPPDTRIQAGKNRHFLQLMRTWNYSDKDYSEDLHVCIANKTNITDPNQRDQFFLDELYACVADKQNRYQTPKILQSLAGALELPQSQIVAWEYLTQNNHLPLLNCIALVCQYSGVPIAGELQDDLLGKYIYDLLSNDKNPIPEVFIDYLGKLEIKEKVTAKTKVIDYIKTLPLDERINACDKAIEDKNANLALYQFSHVRRFGLLTPDSITRLQEIRQLAIQEQAPAAPSDANSFSLTTLLTGLTAVFSSKKPAVEAVEMEVELQEQPQRQEQQQLTHG